MQIALAALALAATPPQAVLSPPATPSACRAEEGYAAAFEGRRTFLLKPDQMVPIKAARDHDPVVRAAYTALIVRADAALRRRPGSVMDKTTLPPSGDRHDYISIAPY